MEAVVGMLTEHVAVPQNLSFIVVKRVNQDAMPRLATPAGRAGACPGTLIARIILRANKDKKVSISPCGAAPEDPTRCIALPDAMPVDERHEPE